ncbi:transglutaminase domain-containing protein, partial [Ruminiclostridium josui]|uniref:transglutaminase domain-containing protein n=1 Tax=Ruminiclostridium josui TaxID=1499 RepID=UPI000B060F33
NLEEIEVSQGNTNYTSQDGVLYNYDKSKLIWYPAKRPATDFSIPDSVNMIIYNAFANATNLKNVNLTSNINTIQSCFSGCELTSINHITTREEYINWDTSIKSVFQNNLNIFEQQPFLKSLVEQEVQYAVDNYIQEGMNDYQKIKALYNYATNKVSYITSGSTSDLKNHCISSIFLGDSTVCEGYTLGMALLLDKVGITNCPVSGGNHAWNLVYLNDTWLQIDATWDDEGDMLVPPIS